MITATRSPGMTNTEWTGKQRNLIRGRGQYGLQIGFGSGSGRLRPEGP
ncbi:MAG: hypothetical protein K9J81_06065 [Desulfohalobiaceae bacterium]|nr:hypothetical protein [Desulfohalobiaceae bacterium]